MVWSKSECLNFPAAVSELGQYRPFGVVRSAASASSSAKSIVTSPITTLTSACSFGPPIQSSPNSSVSVKLLMGHNTRRRSNA